MWAQISVMKLHDHRIWQAKPMFELTHRVAGCVLSLPDLRVGSQSTNIKSHAVCRSLLKLPELCLDVRTSCGQCSQGTLARL